MTQSQAKVQTITNQNTINGVNTDGLNETIQAMKDNPELAKCEFRIRNKWIDGDANCAETYDFYAAGEEQTHKTKFEFRAGEPTLIEGRDEGANPVEFLLASLSGCITTTIAYCAALNGHTIKSMESTYEGDLDMQGLFNLDPSVRPGYQNIRVKFKIETDANKEEIESYYPFSPVYDVVSKSVPVEVTIETC